jgi:pantoate--beta-alanine ligase
MEITREIAATRASVAAARRSGRRIGLVPTMGYLHAGHLSLIAAARRDDCWPVVSLFVNPTQFGPHEDYNRYPRDEAGDVRQCAEAGVELLFAPPVEVMYPAGAATRIHVSGLTDTLCGPCRPGHFDGVATVVTKLFNIVQPERAYFGEKDAQQLAVIRRMTLDLDLPIEIVGCPIVREPDGLALSSRNAMLAPDERARAVALYQSLRAAEQLIAGGERDVEALTAAMRCLIDAARPTRIDYISFVHPHTLQPAARVTGPTLVALAVRIGTTRLIDNMLLG